MGHHPYGILIVGSTGTANSIERLCKELGLTEEIRRARTIGDIDSAMDGRRPRVAVGAVTDPQIGRALVALNATKPGKILMVTSNIEGVNDEGGWQMGNLETIAPSSQERLHAALRG